MTGSTGDCAPLNVMEVLPVAFESRFSPVHSYPEVLLALGDVMENRNVVHSSVLGMIDSGLLSTRRAAYVTPFAMDTFIWGTVPIRH